MLRLDLEREGGAATERTLSVERDCVRIGVHASNDLVLTDDQVSRFHCILTHERGRWRVVDSASRNGTVLNGVAVRDAYLPPDARLEIGQSIVRVRELPSKTRAALAPVATYGTLHGRSEPMRRLFAVLDCIAQSEATVLIEGESGSGKELVTTEIVRRGPRAAGPLVVIDCGAISPQLVESALFGHCRGAFTGADREQAGAFEAAAGGTVFLDEIGEMPLELQPKLLRVLESRAICRVGETRTRRVDVRIIAATNRDLAREVNNGRFREDLFFRLSVVTVRVPPLRERLEDLELLVTVLAGALGVAGAQDLFTREVLQSMAQHDWPGNVRELRNFVERAVIMRHADPRFAPGPVRARREGDGAAADPSRIDARIDIDVPFKQAKESVVVEFEKKYLEALLAAAKGNVSRAARAAAIDRISIHRLMQRHDVRAKR